MSGVQQIIGEGEVPSALSWACSYTCRSQDAARKRGPGGPESPATCPARRFQPCFRPCAPASSPGALGLLHVRSSLFTFLVEGLNFAQMKSLWSTVNINGFLFLS